MAYNGNGFDIAGDSLCMLSTEYGNGVLKLPQTHSPSLHSPQPYVNRHDAQCCKMTSSPAQSSSPRRSTTASLTSDCEEGVLEPPKDLCQRMSGLPTAGRGPDATKISFAHVGKMRLSSQGGLDSQQRARAASDQFTPQTVSTKSHATGLDAFADWKFDNGAGPQGDFMCQRTTANDLVSGETSVRSGPIPSYSQLPRHCSQDSEVADIDIDSSQYSAPPSTRSSSITGQISQILDYQAISTSTTPRHSEALDTGNPAAYINMITWDEKNLIDRQELASTPLLPPMMEACFTDAQKPKSPLQSPKIAAVGFVLPPTGTSLVSPVLEPTVSPPIEFELSPKSCQQPRTSLYPCTAELPLSSTVISTDRWCRELGHANFSISPAPYLPEHVDRATYQQLLEDREEARINYIRHLLRTLEHYGVNSKTYRLTVQKWSEIDMQWDNNCNYVHGQAVLKNLRVASKYTEIVPMELTLCAGTMPTVHDQDKFPNLGDNGIVGPMVQVAARGASMRHQTSRIPKRPNSFLKGLIPQALLRRPKQ